ncbi:MULTISPECIES: AMP-binding protein [unclassified Nocardia]|uniref:AMP-binding protein n=1 Tax=unclassified Nocardia TaxID=2637762 RepID=UPI001CE484E1|nr:MULTISPECIES: AMP-binding protein [unclassified Nocardia]
MTIFPIVASLNGYDDRIAVLCSRSASANVTAAESVTEDLQRVTYARLAALVAEYASTLGPNRRLVALAVRNDLDSLVAYLGALAAGCAVLLTAEITDELMRIYDPDVVRDGGVTRIRRTVTKHRLHPDLALLLSTSGSTGSPKLVRLSYRNLFANAAAIVAYLSLGPDDRAATTLPMFYCYGLSVVHSHLLCGASLLLTERSVLDDEFWAEFRGHRATSFAAVPYTVELLERIGFDRMPLPALRYITLSGGRLAPALVRRYARLGASAGWDFVVMYGQTEATSRMAYLPVRLTAAHPDCVGVAIPGGRFTLESVDGEDAHELVYHGPNVMMGYAESAADLALGRTVRALRTGDLARRTPEGLIRIVGRRSRFAKPFGLRIDLERLESGLAAAGFSACCAEGDAGLVVAVRTGGPATDPTTLVTELSGLPASAIRIVPVGELPRLANGKLDYAAVRGLSAPAPELADIRAIYADALGLRPESIAAERTFGELGGNSLTYVHTSVRLGRVIGALPTDWPDRTVAELSALRAGETGKSKRHRHFSRTIDTATGLRAAGIVLIAGTHIGLFQLLGAAHVLLAVAGFNFARFALTSVPGPARTRHALRTAAFIAVPTALWVAATLPFTDYYGWQNLLLLNKILGPAESSTAGHLWFLEVLVYFLIAAALLIRLPLVDTLERRDPFRFALGLLTVALIFRYLPVGPYSAADVPYSPLAAWFFVVGWAAAKATTTWQRVLVGVIVLVTVPGYFAEAERERLVIACLLLLAWLPALRVPVPIAGVAALLADGSLFVYLLHWQIYPLFGTHDSTALFACLAAGIAASHTVALIRRWVFARSRKTSAFDGPDLGRRVLGQLRDEDVTRNRLAGKVIE